MSFFKGCKITFTYIFNISQILIKPLDNIDQLKKQSFDV